jgi:NAD(P)-dependent dehydrogenase (short-subunit alcohol dehydrogenase family)
MQEVFTWVFLIVLLYFVKGDLGFLKDKIVIITGANSWIGRAAASRFAEKQYKIIMACRNIGKSKKVQREIIEQSKNGRVEFLKPYVSSFQSIGLL